MGFRGQRSEVRAAEGLRRVLGDLRVGLLVGRAVLAWSDCDAMGTQGVALGWYVAPRWGWG